MRRSTPALTVLLCAVAAASAQSVKQTVQSAQSAPDPSTVHTGTTFTPFSSFGSDIPGYQNPTVGGAPAGKASAHPYHPYADFGKASAASNPADQMTGPKKVFPTVTAGAVIAESAAAKEKEEDEEGDAAAAEAAAEASPMDEFGKPIDVEREDAQANFHTVVEAFIAKNSVDGCWPLKESERTLCLTYLSTDTQRLRKDGKGAYKGLVVLHDAKLKVNRAMTFKIDFSGDEWSVVWVKVLGAKTVMYRRKGEPTAPPPAVAPPALPAFRPGVSQ